MIRKGPIDRAIDGVLARQKVSLAMPGHKANPDLSRDLDLARDVTELPGLDALHAPQGCVRESERMVASSFGAAQSFFLVNGASGGLQAALLAAAPYARTAAVPRNAHRSVIQGCLLAGIEPVFVDPEPWRGLLLPPPPARFAQSGADICCVASVSYDGAVRNYESLRGRFARLIADEAHGAHLAFLGMTSALDYADCCVHGAHKTLGSLTQSGLLHVGAEQPRMRHYLSLMESSSPSWLLLASLERAVLAWEQWRREKGFVPLLTRMRDLRRAIRDVCGLDTPEEGWDPLHVHIFAPDGCSGLDLAHALRAGGVEVERAEQGGVLALMSPFDPPGTDERLLAALAGAVRRLPVRTQSVADDPVWPRAKRVLPIAQAVRSRTERIPLARAVGRIAADIVSLYPPGVALLVPGERVEAETVERMRRWREQGRTIENLQDGVLTVIEEKHVHQL